MDRSNDYQKLADSYFNFLAERFPAMCASDEFDFLPRAENAAIHYDKLDRIESNAIEDCIDELKSFQKKFNTANDEVGDLEHFIDLQLLQGNAAGILIELDTKRSWRYNPLLYLKISFIGLDHALNKPAQDSQDIRERSLSRLFCIPDILKHGMNNIRSIPATYYQASLRMTHDCKQYLGEAGNELSKR